MSKTGGISFTQGLQLKQSQSLKMTPQMQQAIRLLQMNNLELEKLVEEEVSQNPLLEKLSVNDFESAKKEYFLDGQEVLEPQTESETMDTQMRNGEMLGSGEVADYENRWDVDSPVIRHAERVTLETSRELANPGQVIEESVSESQTLQAHLRAQIGDENLVASIRNTCLALIEWVDEQGYLREDDKELTETLGIDFYDLDEALGFCRKLLPAGVFARSMPDCLSLQLRDRGLWTPAHDVMLANLDMVMKADLSKLARRCDISPAQLDKMIHDLRALDPHPARAFETDVFQTRPPEVLVTKDPRTQTGWRVELNEETLPRLVVQTGYWEELAAKKMSKDDRKYLQTQYQSGQWLVRAMSQRAATLLQVAQEICCRQKGFLEKGVQALRPMVMRDIAEELDVHESTVSRVVANKLMQTPRGVFEMKYFFNTAIRASSDVGDGSGEVSSHAVRARITELIEGELQQGAKKVLSDEAIAKALKAEGMTIARRTVAKYREAMRLPDSAARKRTAKLRNTP